MMMLRRIGTLFSTFKFKHASWMIPHPEKKDKGGEDACMAREDMLAVADGVGGWAEHGIDPGLYSKKLCYLMTTLMNTDTKTGYIEEPKKLIADAVRQNKEMGTTTICVLSLENKTALLRAAYLGDSVFAVYRPLDASASNYQYIFAAPYQQRQFNFPYQVGTQGDNPALAAYYSMTLKERDVVVIGSDGLWDNMHHEQLLKIVSQKGCNVAESAKEIAEKAYQLSLSRSYESPFHVKAKKARLYYPKYGKSDDITVVVAEVVKDEESPK